MLVERMRSELLSQRHFSQCDKSLGAVKFLTKCNFGKKCHVAERKQTKRPYISESFTLAIRLSRRKRDEEIWYSKILNA